MINILPFSDVASPFIQGRQWASLEEIFSSKTRRISPRKRTWEKCGLECPPNFQKVGSRPPCLPQAALVTLLHRVRPVPGSAGSTGNWTNVHGVSDVIAKLFKVGNTTSEGAPQGTGKAHRPSETSKFWEQLKHTAGHQFWDERTVVMGPRGPWSVDNSSWKIISGTSSHASIIEPKWKIKPQIMWH